MNTKFISGRALSVIDQYLHFKAGNAVCSVPYFNNKTTRARAALRTYIGKGSPKDVFEEVQALVLKNHADLNALTDVSLKKLLVDNSIGIECSGFAYYTLNAESGERGKGALDKHLSFVNCRGLIGKIRCSIRPAENCDVSTFADDKNSRAISVKEAQPGDIITMTGSKENSELSSAPAEPRRGERDHILIIHRIEYQNFIPCSIYYSHAVAYPQDGIYGSGIRQGRIDISFPDKPITEAAWSEDGKTGDGNLLFLRAQRSRTEVRRLKWF
jgi:hypothetical protein